jgi:hypothetical protein
MQRDEGQTEKIINDTGGQKLKKWVHRQRRKLIKKKNKI